MDLSLNSSDPREILYFLYESMVKSKSVDLELIDKTKLMDTTDELRYSDIENEIEIPQDFSMEEKFKVQLPLIDEQESSYYKTTNFIPPSGYFTKLKPRIIRKPYGLLEIEYRGFKRGLNQSDNRYLKDGLLFSQSSYFLFYFDENVYKRVSSKRLEESKFNLSKGRTEMDQIEDEQVKTYLEREEKIKEYRGKVKPIFKERTLNIFELKKSSYDPIYKNSVRSFLSKWKEFLEEHFTEWILSKYVYEIVDDNEFSIYKREGKRLLELTIESIQKLDLIQDDFGSITSLSDDYLDHNFIFKTITELENTVRTRVGGGSILGYLILRNDDGTKIVIENFVMIENRTMILEEKITSDEIEQEKKMLLKK